LKFDPVIAIDIEMRVSRRVELSERRDHRNAGITSFANKSTERDAAS
jgi:hypothetical protein